jgi:Cupin domain
MTELIRIGQLEIRFLQTKEGTGGALDLFELAVPAGAKVPVPHYHRDYDETVYGLSGALAWTLDGARREVGPGEALFIRRGVVHHFANPHAETARPGRADAGACRACLPPRGAALAVPGSPPDPARVRDKRPVLSTPGRDCAPAISCATRSRKHPPMLVKICGIRTGEEASAALDCGATALGFLVGLTHRAEDRIGEADARGIVRGLPTGAEAVLVTHFYRPQASRRTRGVDRRQHHPSPRRDGAPRFAAAARAGFGRRAAAQGGARGVR